MSTESMQLPVPERVEGFRGKVVVVSNRLPVNFEVQTNGEGIRSVSSKKTYGGLVTAITPIVNIVGKDRFLWIGYPGSGEKEALEEVLRTSENGEIPMVPVELSSEETKGYYNEFSNRGLWFYRHGGKLLRECDFVTINQNHSYETYREVNRKFAQATFNNTAAEDFVWVHDYHLAFVGEELRQLNREARKDQKIGFYVHTPEASPEDYEILERELGSVAAKEILMSYLSYDMVGFQTKKDRNNYINCLKENKDRLGLDISFEDRADGGVEVIHQGRKILLKNYIISIDTHAFASQADDPAALAAIDQIYAENPDLSRSTRKVGQVARLERTKGLRHAFIMFRRMLLDHINDDEETDWLGKVQYFLVAPESRGDNPTYQRLAAKLKRSLNIINRTYGEMYKRKYPGREDWVPIVMRTTGISGTDKLAGFYKYIIGEDGLLHIPPEADGANLVVKEGIVSGVGRVNLSRRAGAEEHIPSLRRNGMTIDPYDLRDGAAVMDRTLRLSSREATRIMEEAREEVEAHSTSGYVNDYLGDAMSNLYQAA